LQADFKGNFELPMSVSCKERNSVYSNFNLKRGSLNNG
jgi:hypothetical protein